MLNNTLKASEKVYYKEGYSTPSLSWTRLKQKNSYKGESMFK
jgi:hypothetical protein